MEAAKIEMLADTSEDIITPLLIMLGEQDQGKKVIINDNIAF